MNKKPFTAKVPGLFKKRYTEKKYRKKILAKLFVPADKDLIESLFASAPDPKKGDERWTLDGTKIPDKAMMKRVERIAKEIKRQKGRVNIVSVAAALACGVAVVLALVVFRNQIARVAVVSAMEGAFGARCDIEDIDVNLLDAHFNVVGLEQANRKQPMTNLFEVGRIDVHFDLLELSRGKFVAENVELTGVSWKTARAKDGTLPPKAEKKYVEKKKKEEKDAKPNPVQERIDAELAKIKSGVSVDAGIAAIKDQLDPAAFIEREKAALQTPAVIEDIRSTVPALADKWKTTASDARGKADAVVKDAKTVAAIKVDSLKTPIEVKAALETVDAASKTVKDTLSYAEATSKDMVKDAETVKALGIRAEKALSADAQRLKDLAASVKSVNLESGTRVVSGLIDSFIMNTLGSYYPLYRKGMATVSQMQESGKEKKEAKKESLKKRAGAVSRAVGRTIAFGPNAMPRFVMKNIALSAADPTGAFSGSAGAKDVTNDQDKLGKATSFDSRFDHGTMGESVRGTLDFRSVAAERVNAGFDANGYAVSIDSSALTGVPSLKGTLGAGGTFVVSRDGTIEIDTKMKIDGARLTVAAFNPVFLHSMYSDILSEIKYIDLDVKAIISPDGKIDLRVKSDVDETVTAALRKQIEKIIEQVKAEIRKYAEGWIAEQKAAYASEIARFNEISAKARTAVEDAKNADKIIADKRAALEAKAREQAAAVEAAIRAAADAAEAAARAEADKAAAAAKAAADKTAAEAKAAADKAEADAKAKANEKAAPAKKAAESKVKKLL
jgi:uncharacterized protein (TIGR03545 family)